MEPSPETLIEIGRLCGAWSYLESLAEETIWGILGADERLGPVITGRLDLRARFDLILQHAPKKHLPADVQDLRNISKLIVDATRDRNIIIHGLITAEMLATEPRSPGSIVAEDLLTPHNLTKIPCWTIFKGADAGKSFPISSKAVKIVGSNIQKIGERLRLFNNQFNYHVSTKPHDTVETNWPVPL